MAYYWSGFREGEQAGESVALLYVFPAHHHALVLGIDYYRILGGIETILRRKCAKLTVAVRGYEASVELAV